jgi:hypothetical protein
VILVSISGRCRTLQLKTGKALRIPNVYGHACCVWTRGTQAQNFLYEVDFGHNLTIEMHCTSLNEIQRLLVEIWHTKGF